MYLLSALKLEFQIDIEIWYRFKILNANSALQPVIKIAPNQALDIHIYDGGSLHLCPQLGIILDAIVAKTKK